VCEALTDYARQMGHTPVQAADTPGFIVNHAGRGYGTEALRIVSEGVADFATIDRILRDQVGFKLGPFELFDLTALDVSHPVMESIYRQYYDEPRYRPSVITAQRLAGGVLGKKAGEGFYRYVDGVAQVAPEPPVPRVDDIPPVWVSTRAARRAELYQLLKDLGADRDRPVALAAGAHAGGAAGLRRDHRGRGRTAGPGAHHRHRYAGRRRRHQPPRAGHQPRHARRHA
jgi:3-hydroxybutyryl-CoA dehydrogenase